MIARIYPPSTPTSEPLEVSLPLSKSISIRRLLLDALSGVATPPDEIVDCADTEVVGRALATVGNEREIDVEGCGAAMRFLTALSACTPGVTATLTGNARLCERPIGGLVEALRSLGADISYMGTEGFPPLRIAGRELRGGSVTLRGDVSSQYISALMLIAPTLREGLTIMVLPPVVSEPYIVMTGRMIELYGGTCRIEELRSGALKVTVGHVGLTAPAQGVAEPDWTAASYWFEVAALTGRSLVLPPMPFRSLQGDQELTRYFGQIFVARNCGKPVELYLADTPDLAPTLAATCCGLGVPFRFTGLDGLRIKESDRLAALCRELQKLGYDVAEGADGSIKSSGKRRGAASPVRIATYGDHRMAMAMAPLAAVSPGLEIEAPEVVAKSYPGYWDELRRAGYDVEFE